MPKKKSTDLTLERVREFSEKTTTLVTIDAPLFGSVMILNGRVLDKGEAVEPEKIGSSAGFPHPDRILNEATRFWVQDTSGVRRRKSREEMSELLGQS